MSVVTLHRTEAADRAYALRKACYDEIHAEYRKVSQQIAGTTVGVGARFENANFEEQDRLCRRLAWIARQMLEADRGKISWEQARINTFAVSAPSWLDLPEFKTAHSATEKRVSELRAVIPDICRPVQFPDVDLKSLTDGIDRALEIGKQS
jgi:hypothetical protein